MKTETKTNRKMKIIVSGKEKKKFSNIFTALCCLQVHIIFAFTPPLITT